ncbi:PIN-like domain-containing protein [Streptomyces sp. NPDC102451]|uniref:PIN-like domain-containing protein n=1 Tax=Streptomyces sp. NPDC102451 TaxID=3366177 RepID=UPI00382223DE
MKETFSEYYSPSDAEYSEFLERGMIALDANVLLAPYRVDSDARKQIFDILTQLKDRLWVPYQAGYEFFKNRPAVMAGEDKVYQSLESPLVAARRKIEDHLKSITGHPVVTAPDAASILNGIDQVISTIHTLQKGRDSKLEDSLRNDKILSKWEVLLESRIGTCPSPEIHRETSEAVKLRYAEGVPPGLQDEDKPDNAYGDGILWLQLIDQAKLTKSPTLLITDDVKDDWYRRHGGKTIGPRIELIREMRDSAGVPYYQQPLSFFVQRAGKVLHKPVSDKTVRQVVDLSVPNISGEGFRNAVVSELQRHFPVGELIEYSQEFAHVDLAVRVGSAVVGVMINRTPGALRRPTIHRLAEAVSGRKFDAILLVTRKPFTENDQDTLIDLQDESIKPFDAIHWNPHSSTSRLLNTILRLAEQSVSTVRGS